MNKHCAIIAYKERGYVFRLSVHSLSELLNPVDLRMKTLNQLIIIIININSYGLFF